VAYDAFISYSHAVDGRLAPALQRGLERLARKLHRPRALAVFRDETGLVVNPNLWESIERSLQNSSWFVLLCSPDAAASHWVNREIETWSRTKPPERILPVLTDGTLEWDPTTNDFTPASSAVPPALRGHFADEPLYLDLRWAHSETELDLRNSRFRAAIATIAAPIHGMSRDELDSEDVRLFRKSRRVARGATSVLVILLVLAVALGGLAFQQRDHAQTAEARARREAETARRGQRAVLAYGLAGASGAALHAGRVDAALLLAVEAERAGPSATSAGALVGALSAQPTLDRQLHGLTGTTYPLGFSPDARLFAATDGNQVRIWDVRTGAALRILPASFDGRFADGGRLFVSSRKGSCRSALGACDLDVWDLSTGTVIRRIRDVARAWGVSSDAPILAADAANGSVNVWNVRTGARVASVATGRPGTDLGWFGSFGLPTGIALSADGTAVVLASYSPAGTETIRMWNAASDKLVGPGCTVSDGNPNASTIGNALLGLDVVGSATVHVVQSGVDTASVFDAQCRVDTGSAKSRTIRASGSTPIAGVSLDGEVIATRDGDGNIQLSRAMNGSAIGGTVPAPYGGWMTPMSGSVLFSPDGRFFTASQYAGVTRLWRVAPRSVLDRSLADPPAGPDVVQLLPPPALGLPRLGITTPGEIVDANTHRVVARLPKFGPTSVTAESADGSLIGSLSDRTLTIIDLDKHTTRTEHVNLSCVNVEGLAVSRDLVVLACYRDAPRFLEAIDVSASPWTARVPVALDRGLAGIDLTFDPTARSLAAVGGVGCCSGLQLIDVVGTQLKPREALFGRNVGGVFAPDGRSYVVRLENGEVDRFSLAPGDSTSTVVALPNAKINAVLGVSPDSRLLITDGPGNAIGLWNLTARELLASIPTANISNPGDVDLELDPNAWERDACRIANRNLTRAEFAQYLPGNGYHKTCPDLP
jgi:WD40 repeat protein